MKSIVIPQSSTNAHALVFLTPDVIDPNKTYKPILFAHGIGERGVGTGKNVEAFLLSQVPNLVAIINGGNHILVAPELTAADGVWSNKYGDHAYQQIVSKYKVETKIFVTGLSWGGQLIWPWSAVNAIKVSGVIACCAVYAQAPFANIKCPVLAYHAKDDGSVPFSEGSIAPTQIMQTNPYCELIPYQDGGHAIWNKVFGESKVKALLGASVVVSIPATPTPSPTLKADASATVTNVQGPTALLDGSKSVGYKYISWEVISKPAGGDWNIYDTLNFSKIGTQLKLKNLKQGAWVFEGKAFDEAGNNSTDRVTINVGAVAPSGPAEVKKFTDTDGKIYILYSDKTWQ